MGEPGSPVAPGFALGFAPGSGVRDPTALAASAALDEAEAVAAAQEEWRANRRRHVRRRERVELANR